MERSQEQTIITLKNASIRLNRAFIALGLFSLAVSGFLVANAYGILMGISMMGIMASAGIVPEFSPSLGELVAKPTSDDIAMMELLSALSLSAGYAIAVVVASFLLALILWQFRKRPVHGRELPPGMAAATRRLMPAEYQHFRLMTSDRTTVRKGFLFLDNSMIGRLRAVEKDGDRSPDAGPMRFIIAHEVAHLEAADHQWFTLAGPLSLAAGAAPAFFAFAAAFILFALSLPSTGMFGGSFVRVVLVVGLALVIGVVTFRATTVDRAAFVHVKEWFADRIAHLETGEQPYSVRAKRKGLTDLWRPVPSPAERVLGMNDGSQRAVLLSQMLVLKWLLLRLAGVIFTQSQSGSAYAFLIVLDLVFIALFLYGWPGLRQAWPRKAISLAEGCTGPLLIVIFGLLPWALYLHFIVVGSLSFAGLLPFWSVAMLLCLLVPVAPLIFLAAIIRISPDVEMRGGLWISFGRFRQFLPWIRHRLAALGDMISAILVAFGIYGLPPTLLLVFHRHAGTYDAQYQALAGLVPSWIYAIDPVLAVIILCFAVFGGLNVFQPRRWTLICEGVLIVLLALAGTYGYSLINNAFTQAANGLAPSVPELVARLSTIEASVAIEAIQNSAFILVPLALLFWCRWSETKV